MPVKISQILPVPKTVETGNGSFEVYGIGTEDITRLIGKYRVDFFRLFTVTDAGVPDYSSVISVAPKMATDIIAAGARVTDQEDIDAINQLPFGVQLAALECIWQLTVPDPKKLKPLLLKVLGGIRQAAAEVESQEKTSPTLPQQNVAG